MSPPSLPSEPEEAEECEAGWTGSGGSCLKVVGERAEWGEAEERCVREGGHLAALTNPAAALVINRLT